MITITIEDDDSPTMVAGKIICAKSIADGKEVCRFTNEDILDIGIRLTSWYQTAVRWPKEEMRKQ